MVFEEHWQKELNDILVSKDLAEKPFICILALKLAACQYLNNPERLANGVEYQEAIGIQQMYLEYLARRKELDTGDRLTDEEERVLMPAMVNKANKQRLPKNKRKNDTAANEPYFIHNLIVERSRLLDHELYDQLRQRGLIRIRST